MKKQKDPIWLTVVRIVLACVFIFSGLSKAIDPVASGIQMNDYFISFGMGFMHPFCLLLGILMNIAEFTLGFMLLFKIRVRLTTLGYLLFMVFFFFLTAWLAIAEHLEIHYGYHFDVVKDCGCFGKAIKMSNLETFMKNIGLLFFTLIVFAKRKTIQDIRLTPFGQWLFACLGAAIPLLIQVYCLRNLPLIDFSDWKKNEKNVTDLFRKNPKETNVINLFVGKPAEMEILLLYKNENGEERLLSMEEIGSITETIPDFYNKFTYIDRIDSTIVEAIKPVIEGFSMLDDKGRDFASIYLHKEQLYLLFIHDLDEANDSAIRSDGLKNLVAQCKKNNIDFVAVTNSSPEEIKQFIKKYNITFPIYYNPIDPIKGPFIVRDAIHSNPGLIVLQNEKVVEKIPWRKF